MRISTLSLLRQRQAEVARSEARLIDAQDQVSSGKRLRKASDDPTGAVETLSLRSRIATRHQQSSGIQSAVPLLSASDNALGGIAEALTSARAAGLRAASDAVTSPADRAALAAQVRSAAQVALGRANAQVGGRYLFGGTASDRAPFVGAPATYGGDDAPLTLGLGEAAPFAVSVPGSDLAGGQGSADLFANLSRLESAIAAGDTPAVQSALTAVAADFDRVVSLRAEVGSRLNYLETAQRTIDQDVAALETRRSALEDVDLAQAVVAVQTAQNAHEAALAMAGRIGAQSLLDYLR